MFTDSNITHPEEKHMKDFSCHLLVTLCNCITVSKFYIGVSSNLLLQFIKHFKASRVFHLIKYRCCLRSIFLDNSCFFIFLIKVLGKPQPCQLCIAQKSVATPLSSWELHFLFKFAAAHSWRSHSQKYNNKLARHAFQEFLHELL